MLGGAIPKREDLARVHRLLAALPDRHAQPIEARRAGLDAFGGRVAPPEATRVEPTALAGIGAERISSAESIPSSTDSIPNWTLLFLHGGAYVAGSLHSHRAWAAQLAVETPAVVYTLDYRLAPEDPFPAAVEDAVAAFCELSRGRPVGGLAIAGDSAGGGLALATALALRDRGGALPCAVACVSPWLDLSCESGSHETRAEADPFLTTDGLRKDAAAYLAGADPRQPLASPLFGDLAGLPPLLLQVGSDEILADDARRMEAAAHAVGVPARLEVWPQMFHVWQAFRGLLPEAAAATSALAGYLHAAFEGARPVEASQPEQGVPHGTA